MEKYNKINNKGFTLIEVIAAVAILGILSGTAITGVSRYVSNSHEEYCTSQADMLEIAGRDYFNDNNTLLPLTMGGRNCVSLQTLINNKYIETMKDYSDSVCNVNNSKVCTMKHIASGYIYSTYLDCNRCNNYNKSSQDDLNESNVSTPTISYIADTTPAGSCTNAVNKDITVTIKFSDSKHKIVSYSYTVYQKTNSGDVAVETIDYREYKNKDIKVKLNRKGTYYIVATAYNSIGKKGEEKSCDYVLRYNLNCSSQIEISAKKKETGANLSRQTWMKGTLQITVKKSGDVESYDVYISKSNGTSGASFGAYQKVISLATAQSRTITYSSSETGKYRVKVVAYNDQGDTCTKGGDSTFEYWQDNTDPTCTTVGAPGRWVNYNVTLTGRCSDPHSGCDNSKPASNYLSYEYDGYASAGRVYDNVGNVGYCNDVWIGIDKTPPTCEIELDGDEGNNDYYISDVTANLSFEDPGEITSEAENYGISTSSSPTYNGSQTYTHSSNTNNYVNVYGYIKDNAGNTGKCSEKFKLDKTPPTYRKNSVQGTRVGSGYADGSMLSVTCSDVGSGPINTSDQVYFYGSEATLNGYCEDKAGNVSDEYDITYHNCPNSLCGYDVDYNIRWNCYNSYGNLISSPCESSSNYFPACCMQAENYCSGESSSSCGVKSRTKKTCWHQSSCQSNTTTSPPKVNDKTPPGCPSVSSDYSPNSKGWTNKNVKLTFSFTSDTKKYTFYTKEQSSSSWKNNGTKNVSTKRQTISQEGIISTKVDVYDASGNKKTCTFTDKYKIDKTAPYTPYIDKNDTKNIDGETVKVNYYGDCDKACASANPGNKNSASLQSSGKTCFTDLKCSVGAKSKVAAECVYSKDYSCGTVKVVKKDSTDNTPNVSGICTDNSDTYGYQYYNCVRKEGSTTFSDHTIRKVQITDCAGNKSKVLTISELGAHIYGIGLKSYYQISNNKWTLRSGKTRPSSFTSSCYLN